MTAASAILAILLAASFVPPSHAADTRKVAWSYDNDYTGQEEWGYLTPAYAACGMGTQQSPIVISATQMAPAPAAAFNYRSGKASLIHRGFTVEIAPQDEQIYTEGGIRYSLRAIQFHSPSEHMIKDDFFPLEIHLIHEDAKKNKLILAVFGTSGAEVPLLSEVLAKMPAAQDTTAESEFDASALIPPSSGYYAYPGSLTVPPCTEGVEWRVFKTPITLSVSQLQQLTKFIRRNARLPQPVYMRTVKEIN